MTLLLAASGVALVVWVAVLALPSRPFGVSQRLELKPSGWPDLSDVAVLIPARNEAGQIGATLTALAYQGQGLLVRVVDDDSSDSTATICRAFEPPPAAGPNGEHPGMKVELHGSQPLPPGWGGKLWALEQGLPGLDRPWILLLDADIELDTGVVAELKRLAIGRDAALVSVMATLRAEDFWERLLVPAFVYFFKMLYPFARVADPESRVAAAAGGLILIRREWLGEAGAFSAFRDALIDDCELAARVKCRGGRLWLGMSEAVNSLRPYDFTSFWRMVSRTAFTQLKYSPALLVLTIAALAVLFVVPPVALVLGPTWPTHLVGAAALLALSASYVPVVRFYDLGLSWTLTLPAAALAFGAMTIASAINYWRGTRAEWKDRIYEA